MGRAVGDKTMILCQRRLKRSFSCHALTESCDNNLPFSVRSERVRTVPHFPEPRTGLTVRFTHFPELRTGLTVRFSKSSVRTVVQNRTLTPLL
jgi:hypothetical protein